MTASKFTLSNQILSTVYEMWVISNHLSFIFENQIIYLNKNGFSSNYAKNKYETWLRKDLLWLLSNFLEPKLIKTFFLWLYLSFFLHFLYSDFLFFITKIYILETFYSFLICSFCFSFLRNINGILHNMKKQILSQNVTFKFLQNIGSKMIKITEFCHNDLL